MPRPPDDSRLTRRQFLACCSALAVSGSACATLGPDTRSAYALLTDPPLDDYEPILKALIQTVLPCERPDFPVTVTQVHERLLRIFQLESDPRFLLLQRSLVLFDQPDLFPHLLPLMQEERRLRAGHGTRPAAEAFADDLTHDRDLYNAFAGASGATRFTALALDRQRAYFDLWRRSRFLLRRAFHATSRSLIMISAYSMDETWPVIGYAGPLPGTRGAGHS